MQKPLLIVIFIISLLISKTVFADGSINAFYVGETSGKISEVQEKIEKSLKEYKFEIIGNYNPGRNAEWSIVAFTNKHLKEIAFGMQDKSAMGAVLRVGFRQIDKKKVEVSLLNPTYLFYSYFRSNFVKYEEDLNDIAIDALVAVSGTGVRLFPAENATMSEQELKTYKYMVKMPDFGESLVIKEFTSFEEGVASIKKNLAAQKSGTFKVYEIIDEKNKIAIFGIGLLDARIGEAKFLPILGAERLTALPYELVIIDKQASMLNGRFRFPLYWPDLTMRDFQKIGRTHRDIQTMMEYITQ